MLKRRTLLLKQWGRFNNPPRYYVALEFEPRDLWIGLYWRYEYGLFQVFVCIVPLFPISFSWFRGGK